MVKAAGKTGGPGAGAGGAGAGGEFGNGWREGREKIKQDE